jgi:hypothetical protein
LVDGSDDGTNRKEIRMKAKPESKEQRLFKMLKRRWVSPQVAAESLSIYSLAQRVSEWRAAGVSIADEWVSSGRSRFKKYRIEGGRA